MASPQGSSPQEVLPERFEWGTEPMESLDGTRLEWSTIEEVDAKKKERKGKTCRLCGKTYAGGPDAIRAAGTRHTKFRQKL